MAEWLLRRFNSNYILVLMLATRVVGSIGGGLTIYYVSLGAPLPPEMRTHFDVFATLSIGLAVLSTILLAQFETRNLRAALDGLAAGVPIPDAVARQAGREAVQFASRHHRHEAFLVPLVTVVPVCGLLRLLDNAPLDVLVQIVIAAFLGISVSLLCTFFVIERCMVPVVHLLRDNDVEIAFDELPPSHMHMRMNLSFGLIILVTALMIGAVATQRAMDIVRNPERQNHAVTSLREHTICIMLAAVTFGLIYSRMLAHSITSRTGNLLAAMKRVQGGSLSERVWPTGNDEIDILARQFNAMVEQLDRNDQTIRDLNANLEQKVHRRTRQLSKSKQSLQKSLRQLQEHDQLKTQFFSNVSHELRTPLTMILSPVEWILETQGERLPPDVTSLMRITRINGKRLLKLINQLLDFSKLEAGHAELKLTTLDLNGLVQELVTAAQPLSQERGLELRVVPDASLPPFGADEEKIDTIISNLLSNAIKFTPQGGTVEIRTLRTGDSVEVSVTDTGIGLDESDCEKVFERFVQIDGSASREFSGTGLGLALSKELVELHGGTIHAEGRPGAGSRFWFTLPLREAPHDSADAVSLRDSSVSATRYADLAQCDVELPVQPRRELADDVPTVLVVDDTAEVRMLLGTLLSDEYRVLYAADGREGFEVARRERPDLILSDAMMPNVDGYEFCRRVKETPDLVQIPFVMLTAKAELSMKIDGLNWGVDDYLTKPFDSEELKARVRSLLRLRVLHHQLDQRNRELERTLNELRDAQVQLIHSEKMNSLGQLVAGLAHEINNSINAVYNGIHPLHKRTKRLQTLVDEALIQADPSAPDKSQRREIETAFAKISQLADVIENGATRTARIVSDLKTFSHPGAGSIETFDLNQALEMCLNLMWSQIKHQITVHKDYGEVGTIHGPAGQLNQVFMNILSNAQQAIRERGDIWLATNRVDEQVTISIRDNGCGIPDDVKSRIFDPFFTTKPPGVGTGLGLSISYRIITNLGGTLECRSESGNGTEFLITLPCSPRPIPEGADALWGLAMSGAPG